MEEKIGLSGKFVCEIYDKDGNLKETFECPNVVTKEGKMYMLQAGVSNETSAITNWYVGLIGADVTPSENDTASSALGTSGSYQEITAYLGTTRPTYSAEGDTVNRNVSNNNNPASFEATSSFTTYGAFITSTSAKQSNSGRLLCAGRFSISKSLSSGEILVVKYTISA